MHYMEGYNEQKKLQVIYENCKALKGSLEAKLLVCPESEKQIVLEKIKVIDFILSL